MDDNAAGSGWFFDQTPLDDAEFTAIANSGSTQTGTAFQASFVDVSTGGTNYNDFYRTIVHEIGHAMGILVGAGSIFNFQTVIGSFPSGETLYSFQNPNGQYGVTATFTDDGTVEPADYYVWTGHYGNTLTLLGIQINGLP